MADLMFRIHHTMLPVVDLERSIEFYTRILGMRVMGRRRNEARKTMVGHVGYGDRDVQPSLELTQAEGIDPLAQVRPTGVHVAIQVNDLMALWAGLESSGAMLQQPPTGRPGSRNLTAWIRDPDGHELELIERHPEP